MKIGLLFLLAVICLTEANDNVPVLIFQKDMESNDNTVTVGHTLSSDDFLKLLTTIKGDVDVLLVDELDDQDLRQVLREQEKSSLKDVHYEPSVNSAYPTLKSFLDKNGLNANIEDFKMDISSALADFKLRQDISNFIVLTALKSKESTLRTKRQAENEPEKVAETMTTVFGSNCAATYTRIYFMDNSNPTALKTVIASTDSTQFTCSETVSSLKLTISSNKTLLDGKVKEINLNFKPGSNPQYWDLASNSSVVTSLGSYGITYMGSPYGMETPNLFSFVCTKTYFQLYNSSLDTKPLVKVSLYIENLQVQPNRVENNGTDFTFGKVNYCQGFFTSGIWMALLSTFLLTFILAVGISCLASINTMDKFDDPKGKPLTIAMEK